MLSCMRTALEGSKHLRDGYVCARVRLCVARDGQDRLSSVGLWCLRDNVKSCASVPRRCVFCKYETAYKLHVSLAAGRTACQDATGAEAA